MTGANQGNQEYSFGEETQDDGTVAIEDIFPYPSPRSSQEDAIKTIGETCDAKNGFTVVEGACGTGKTLAALTPLIRCIRKPNSGRSRIVAVTSVKQQMEAFQEEIRNINSNLKETDFSTVSGITAVGLGDLHPYLVSTDIDVSSTGEIQRLREGTRDLVKKENDVTAESLASSAEQNSSDESGSLTCELDGETVTFPYRQHVPSYNGVDFDPFYAEYLACSPDKEEDAKSWDGINISHFTTGLLTQADLLRRVGTRGICPHSFMRTTLPLFEVVIGNYYHVFEPQTARLVSGDIIGEDSFIVLDEAHNTVPKVRELLSDELTGQTFNRALNQIEECRLLYNIGDIDVENAIVQIRDGEVPNEVWDGRYDVSDPTDLTEQYQKVTQKNGTFTGITNEREAIDAGQTFRAGVQQSEHSIEVLDKIESVIKVWLKTTDAMTTEYLEDEFGSEWKGNLPVDELPDADEQGSFTEEEVEVPFRDPTEPQPGPLTERFSLHFGGGEAAEELREAAETLSQLRREAEEVVIEESTDATHIESVGKFIESWLLKDSVKNFRVLNLTQRGEFDPDSQVPHLDWTDEYMIQYEIKNCIPRYEIAEKLQDFGGGVVMSATLEPLSVFKKVCGISLLNTEHNRAIASETYGLAFPEDNRKTIAVDVPPFTYSNKGGSAYDSRGIARMNETREQYVEAVAQLIDETDGKTLVCLPSYEEAEWMSEQIAERNILPDRHLLLDGSSSNAETDRLKQSFFSRNRAALFTAAHGTLVEGVDYDGDKLSAAITVGVPIENTQSPYKKAIRAAYDDEFGSSNGFEYAYTVPAVRKVRQAIGRVIRQDTDTGVRVFADSRYYNTDLWNSVVEYLSEQERTELEPCRLSSFGEKTRRFWETTSD